MHDERFGLEMNDEHEAILVEARARIIWGSRVSEVREWLQSRGVAQEQIDTIVQRAQRERAIEIRKVGLRDIVIGVLLFSLSAVFFVALPLHGGVYARPSITGLFAVLGVWRVAEGIWRLFCGNTIRGSLTDIDSLTDM